MWARIYSIIGGVALFGYGMTTLTGHELFTISSETPAQAAAARHASGGHRSHSGSFFWFFRGGK